MRCVEKSVRVLRLAKSLPWEDRCQSGFKCKSYQRIDCGQNLLLKTLNKLSKAFRIPASKLFELEQPSFTKPLPRISLLTSALAPYN